MIYIIIRETKHPVTGKRSFRALPSVYADETEAALDADMVAKSLKCRAWCLEFPDPPLLEVTTTAEIKAFKR